MKQGGAPEEGEKMCTYTNTHCHICVIRTYFLIYTQINMYIILCVCVGGGGSQSNLSTKHDCLASVIDAEE